MADFTMCTTDDCPLRNKCYRYSAEPDEVQAFKRYEYVTSHNIVTCEQMIPICKLDAFMGEAVQEAAAKPFNDALVTQLAEVTMTRKTRRKSSKSEVTDRVIIARDMLERGAKNRDIYRATKEQTGHAIGAPMLSAIRAGNYVGWGADVLTPQKRITADVPPARVIVDASKVVKSVTLQQALRLVAAAMREEKIAKLQIYDDGRVKASVHETKEWTID